MASTTARSPRNAVRHEDTPASNAGNAGNADTGRFHTTASFVTLNLYCLVLTAFWTPLNTLVLPGLVDERAPSGIRGSALGALSLVGVGIAVLVQPSLGALSDRWRSPERRRLPIVAGSALAAPLAATLWLVPSFFAMLLCYVVLQCAMNAAQAAFQALIPDHVAADDRQRASGIKTAIDVGGNAVGLALAGGILLVGGGTGMEVAVLVVIVAAGAVIGWFTVPRNGNEPAALEPVNPVSVFAPLKEGTASFRSAILLRFLFMLGLYPIQKFILFLLEDRYGIDDPLARASVFVVLAIVVAAAGGLVAGFLDSRFPTNRLLTLTVLLATAALVGVAFAPNLAILVLPAMVLAFVAGAFQALNWGTIANALPDEEAARYFGIANIATAGASALTGIFGPLVDLANEFVPGATYQVLFMICALVTLSCLAVIRRAPAPER